MEKAKDYVNLINRIKSSTNPDVQALLSDVPSCSRETAAIQEVSVGARRRGRPAVQSNQLIDEVFIHKNLFLLFMVLFTQVFIFLS